MPITVTCPGCQKTCSVKDEAAGKRAKCKLCGAVFTIPASQEIPKVAPLQAAEEPIRRVPMRLAAWIGTAAIGLGILVETLAFFSSRSTKSSVETPVATRSTNSSPSDRPADAPADLGSISGAPKIEPLPESVEQEITSSVERETPQSDADAAMCYSIVEADGQFTVVIHNSPIGDYRYNVPNLNGIHIGYTDDRKHQISVSAFQGEVELVEWNDTAVPPTNSNVAASAGGETKPPTRDNVQPTSNKKVDSSTNTNVTDSYLGTWKNSKDTVSLVLEAANEGFFGVWKEIDDQGPKEFLAAGGISWQLRGDRISFEGAVGKGTAEIVDGGKTLKLSFQWSSQFDLRPLSDQLLTRHSDNANSRPPAESGKTWQSDAVAFGQAVRAAIKNQENLEAAFTHKQIEWTVTVESVDGTALRFREAKAFLDGEPPIEVWVTLKESESQKAARLKPGDRVTVNGKIGFVVTALERRKTIVMIGPHDSVIKDTKAVGAANERVDADEEIADDPRQASVESNVTLAKVQENPAAYRGKKVRWFGQLSSMRGSRHIYINNPDAATAADFQFFAVDHTKNPKELDGHVTGTITGDVEIPITITSAAGAQSTKKIRVPLLESAGEVEE